MICGWAGDLFYRFLKVCYSTSCLITDMNHSFSTIHSNAKMSIDVSSYIKTLLKGRKEPTDGKTRHTPMEHVV